MASKRRRQRSWSPGAGERIGRRGFTLRVAGGIAALALGGCSRSPAAATGSGACTLYPRQTEGPFFLDADLLRRHITEGRPGTPLALELRVVRAGTCAPIEGAIVDVWHCDAFGVYSGYPGQLGRLDTRGETFLARRTRRTRPMTSCGSRGCRRSRRSRLAGAATSRRWSSP